MESIDGERAQRARICSCVGSGIPTQKEYAQLASGGNSCRLLISRAIQSGRGNDVAATGANATESETERAVRTALKTKRCAEFSGSSYPLALLAPVAIAASKTRPSPAPKSKISLPSMLRARSMRTKQVARIEPLRPTTPPSAPPALFLYWRYISPIFLTPSSELFLAGESFFFLTILFAGDFFPSAVDFSTEQN